MKLKLITLNRETFTVEVEPTNTIMDLKQKVSEVKNYDANNQKIIYKGKILADNDLIEKYDFKETDTIVVMELKKKAVKPVEKKEEVKEEVKKEEKKEEKKESATTSSGTTSTAPAPESTPAPTTESNLPSSTTSAPTTQNAEQSTFDPSGSSFVTGSVYEQAVNNLIEMGFEKEKVVQAMRASYNNPDRAAEYLMNGIPEHLLQQQHPAQAQQSEEQQAAPQTTTESAATPQAATNPQQQENVLNLFGSNLRNTGAAENRGAATPAAAQGGNPLSSLRDDPQFQRLREQISTNPQLLQSIIQSIGQYNPELLDTITRNPEEFARILEGEGAEGGEQMPQNAIQIEITEEENNAISRLEALGFERQLAIEAYLICDKNEELAANYLFNNQNEQWD